MYFPKHVQPHLGLERMALHYRPFDADTLLTLIKHLVAPEYSLYIWPNTHWCLALSWPLGVPLGSALRVILSQTGPYIRNAGGGSSSAKGISMLAIGEQSPTSPFIQAFPYSRWATRVVASSRTAAALAMVLSVINWIWIDSVISHCPRSHDWRPHTATAVGTLQGMFFTIMQWS
ncbi:hypothetical protein BJV74DRAFT_799487 [Russula compacta]|nr:hypothetical protein BJV74DRAFT_799487 [Russula compacta]